MTDDRDTEGRRDDILVAAAVDALEAEAPLRPEDEVRLDPFYFKARTEFESVLAHLSYGVDPVAPPAGLKGKLMARIAEEEAPKSPEASDGGFEVKPGVRAVRTARAEWLDAPLPGMTYKVIHQDAERGYTTRLVRFEPGVRYPKHRHGGTEEIFLLEGKVWVNGTLLQAGDYCRSEAGTEEIGTYSETAAMAIVISSDMDEISTS